MFNTSCVSKFAYNMNLHRRKHLESRRKPRAECQHTDLQAILAIKPKYLVRSAMLLPTFLNKLSPKKLNKFQLFLMA